MKFEPKKFFKFLDIRDGSVRAKWYISILKGIALGVVLYLIMRPNYKTTQNSNPTFKGATITELNYNTYQNAPTEERNKWVEVEARTDKVFSIHAGYKF